MLQPTGTPTRLRSASECRMHTYPLLHGRQQQHATNLEANMSSICYKISASRAAVTPLADSNRIYSSLPPPPPQVGTVFSFAAFSFAAQNDTAFWLESQRTYFFRSFTSIFFPRTMHARSCTACRDMELVDQLSLREFTLRGHSRKQPNKPVISTNTRTRCSCSMICCCK